MNVLVTGGAGFIGSHVVRHALADGHQVRVLDAFTYAGHRSTLADVANDIEIVEGDVCHRDVVRDALRDVDAVLHLAAETHVDRSIVGPDAFVRTNCDGTNVVCDEARRSNVGRVVHVSTDEVYGSLATGAASEHDVLRPSSPYAASKAASDLLALSYFVTFGLDVVVTRCTNNLGSYQQPEKLIPLAIARLSSGQTMGYYGDGLHERDWLSVDDHASGLMLLLRNGVSGDVYNIGADHQRTNLDVLGHICDTLGVDRERLVPVADRLGHDRRYAVVSDKMRALGWAPTISGPDAIDATIAWYLDNRQWWEPLVAQSSPGRSRTNLSVVGFWEGWSFWAPVVSSVGRCLVRWGRTPLRCNDWSAPNSTSPMRLRSAMPSKHFARGW
jgi:dTDP-glucose 4,6-dehydratase